MNQIISYSTTSWNNLLWWFIRYHLLFFMDTWCSFNISLFWL